MAEALPEDGMLITLEKDPHHIEIAKQNFAKCPVVSDKITIVEGKAIDG